VTVAERAAINQRQIRSASDVCISVFTFFYYARTIHFYQRIKSINQRFVTATNAPALAKNMSVIGAASMIE